MVGRGSVWGGGYERDQTANESIHKEKKAQVDPQGNLVGAAKRRKVTWFCHITGHKSLVKIVLQGTLEGGR